MRGKGEFFKMSLFLCGCSWNKKAATFSAHQRALRVANLQSIKRDSVPAEQFVGRKEHCGECCVPEERLVMNWASGLSTKRSYGTRALKILSGYPQDVPTEQG